MTITDGVTTLTFADSDLRSDSEIEYGEARTVGSVVKTQISGERFTATDSIRITGAQYRTLIDLLKNNAADYYYTPTTVPPEYSSTNFPMKARINVAKKSTRAYNGAIYYYVDLNIISSELL